LIYIKKTGVVVTQKAKGLNRQGAKKNKSEDTEDTEDTKEKRRRRLTTHDFRFTIHALRVTHHPFPNPDLPVTGHRFPASRLSPGVSPALAARFRGFD
jgi:hypothetical protein